MVATAEGKRRRRTVAEAKAEIIAAAGALLQDRSAEEVTVSAIMSRTTLTRKSFYVYFPDRVALLRELVEPLRTETDAAISRWRTAAEPHGAAREALSAAAWMYQRDGTLLRTLAVASTRDAEAAHLWREFLAPLEGVAADMITRADPRLPALAVARALVTMNVNYLLDEVVDATPEVVEAAVNTLAVVWGRTLFPHS